MSALNDIFSKVIYSEIIPLFDEMESIFQSLMADYALDVSEEVSDEVLFNLLDEQQRRWDKNIYQREREWNAYFGLSREIYQHIENSHINGDNEDKNEKLNVIIEKLEPLRRWIYEAERHYYLLGILYHSQRMIQLRNVIELYQKDVPKDILTLQHLFEQGLKRVKVDADRYIDIVFSTRGNRYIWNQSVLSFLTSRLINDDGSYVDNIKWVLNAKEALPIEEALSANLKYADLARRKHSKKGFPVETLNRYKFHFNKYGAKDINGRFHLQRNMNGFVGCKRDEHHTIVIGFAGTEKYSPKNWWSDYRQFTGHLDPVYIQAAGVLNAVWMGKRHKAGFQNARIIVCGHSLGGGLMQYSVAWMDKPDISGYGYNSAGLSRENVDRLIPIDDSNIYHLYQPNDAVFTISSCTQLGRSVKLNTIVPGRCKAHELDTMRSNLRTHRNEVAKLV
jgi:hypothetical protein